MLNLRKVLALIKEVESHNLVDRSAREAVIANAQLALEEASLAPSQFLKRLEAAQGSVLWPVSFPLETFGQQFLINSSAESISVVAADGSQIMPSHHEVFSCYLLNIGVIAIAYGAPVSPILETEPRLYHRPEDLYPLVDRRRLHIDELYVSLERNLQEMETLLKYSLDMAQHNLPVIALLDGSLIPWSVEKMSPSYQDTHFKKTLAMLEAFRQANIALIGYLSHSRSADLINSLRIWRCPYEKSKCREFCASLNEEDFPCSSIWPIADRQLLSAKLKPGQRTSIFLSGASTASNLPDNQHTCFVYLNVGTEIARLEFPQWLTEDRQVFDRAMAVVLSQVKKGLGYPLCLAEAHNLAVISGLDRKQFFNLLSSHLVAQGIEHVRVSPKEARKRHGIV